ncbi:PREDICTED: glucan endo-1,3-beta-glucosidase 13-like [Ipomoea nil]|uniref:glucan endo-1,3-beta-glucosidase 13-like n=1 Tax=Ipomoea nil TaxID=35883 RepID=UPI000901DA63|nr:PREDICTED: glucan endo-1,3-beta-glucosidase 13-like [Ipomoea nil]
MAFPRLYSLCIFASLFLSLLRHSVSGSGSIGINYGRIADDLPSPAKVVQLLKSQGITKVKLYDTDSTVLDALSGSGISTTVALPNEQLSAAAASQSFTDRWVQSNIVPYKSIIETVAVGNEVFVDPANTTPYLVPAMKNVYASLAKYGVAPSVKVSSPIGFSAMQTSYPPSSGSFKPELIPVIKPMLSFLEQTGSFLMLNAYPFYAYEANTDKISLDYAVFGDNQGVVDPNNGLVYKSLFDAQVDAVYAAINAVKPGHFRVVISESGWPSKGNRNAAAYNGKKAAVNAAAYDGETGPASAVNAAAYNGNLVRRVLTGGGTPLRPDEPLSVYLFSLFNENQKSGPISERNYGLFYPNEQKVYDVPLTLAALGNRGSKAQVPPTWCVANGDVGPERLQVALDYACGQGAADCGPIQPGSTCYNPNTLVAHASYAFNSYYQKNARGPGTCYFGGAGYVVTQPPRFGSCEFPTGY